MVAKVCGFFGAFLVFLVMFLLLVIFKGPLVHAFPPSVMLYELIKLEPPVPGAGLVIDQLHAEVKGKNLEIDGRVINLTTKDIDIPPLTVSLIDKNGDVISAHAVTIEDKALEGESDVLFKMALPEPGDAAVSLKAGFILP